MNFPNIIRSAIAFIAIAAIWPLTALAELKEALPGTRYDWECTGDWDAYSEIIVSADADKLVKDSLVDGKPWSRTWRRSWLRGAALYYKRDFEKFGVRTIDYDWEKLRGFDDMEVGWSRSGTATLKGEGRNGPYTQTLEFSISHESRQQLSSPVYGDIDVVKTVTKMRYGDTRNECVALMFPADAAQVEFECRIYGGRTNLDFTCKLEDRY